MVKGEGKELLLTEEQTMPEATIREIEFAPGQTISIETGRLAKQADGSVVVRQGDTMVLCTAVLSKTVREGQSFFPLTVEYREKYSAGGKISGGFIKREGRPTDKEVLDRKSTRLNSSHVAISYAVFCLKKKRTHMTRH